MMLTAGAVLFWIVLLPLAGAVAIGYLLYRFMGERFSADRQQEETRLIQELHQGLSRLESRVESLETLLMEQENIHEKR